MAPNEPPVSYRHVAAGSNRSFGLVFAGFFALVGLWLAVSGQEPRWWPFIIAALFLLTAIFAPAILQPLNRLWSRLGHALHRIVNPVIMAVIFFGALLPTALIVRLFGRNPLRLKRDPDAVTYWIARQPPGPAANSMRKQF